MHRVCIGFASCEAEGLVLKSTPSGLRTGIEETPIKLETGLRSNSAGIPYTLLLRIEAMGFPSWASTVEETLEPEP